MQTNLNEDRPIFIVGVPRSGTTLIRTILSAHPNIAISPPSKYFNYWLKHYSHLNIANDNDFESFWKDFSNSKLFSHFDVDVHSIRDRILASDNISHKTIFTSLLQAYASKMGKSRWGDKTAGHFPYVDKLFEWYPQARIIWMLRDPRAVTKSLVSLPWSSRADIDIRALHWKKGARMLKTWTTDKRVLVVKFEELVFKPNETVPRICEFVEEEYTPTMIENRSQINTPIINYTDNSWTNEYIQKSLKPIDSNNLNKWKSSLSLREITLIEHIVKVEMTRYDYQSITEGLNNRLYFDWQIARAVRKVKHLKNKVFDVISNHQSSQFKDEFHEKYE